MSPRHASPSLVLAFALGSVATASGAPPKIEDLYKANCAGCHGPEMRGGSGKSLVSGVWKHGSRDEDIAAVIVKGVPAMGMPPMEKALTPAQVRAMVVYIREQEAHANRAPAPRPDENKVFRVGGQAFRMETVATLSNTPWGVVALPEGGFLVTEKSGALRTVGADGKLAPKPVEGVPASIDHGQGGLMDVALHPDYAKNGLIYLSLNEGSREGGRTRCATAIVRGRIKDGRWTDNEWIWKVTPEFHIDAGIHFGSRIVFDGKGHVFFSSGERGRNMNRGAQDITTPYGKIIRVNEDGSPPADNPFAKDPKAYPGVWSYGHRNPQGLAVDPKTGDLWENEHGPRGGDELNLIRPGLNYGWPVVTFGMNYDGRPWEKGETARPEMEPPVTYWTPSIAVCGMAFVAGDRYPAWKGDCLVGALAGQEVRRLRIVDRKVTEQEVLFRGLGRVRDVKCGPDGLIYVVFNGPDRLVRLVPQK